jgi:hypothetical protein
MAPSGSLGGEATGAMFGHGGTMPPTRGIARTGRGSRLQSREVAFRQ